MTKGTASLQMTCFKVVCLSCLCRHCVRVWGSDTSAPALTGLRLTDSEKVVCPQYKNKSSISCFVRRRLCLTSSGDCQVTFRKPSHLFLSVCHAKASLLPFFSPPSFSFTAEKQVHCDSECSSTPQWVLFEMRFERVSTRERERDREPRAAERLDE